MRVVGTPHRLGSKRSPDGAKRNPGADRLLCVETRSAALGFNCLGGGDGSDGRITIVLPVVSAHAVGVPYLCPGARHEIFD
jgi:hypothetical protein